MKKKLKKLLHINMTAALSIVVVAVMAAATAMGGVGKNFLFQPDDTPLTLSYGTPEGAHAYDLSEEDENGKNVSPDSDRKSEPEPEQAPPDEPVQDVILPEDLISEPAQLQTVETPVDHSSQVQTQPGAAGTAPQGPPLVWQPDEPGLTDPEPGPVEGSEPGLEPEEPEQPSGGDERPEQPWTPPGDDTPPSAPDDGKIVVGGKEYDSIDDALADIADNLGTNENGQYFEGFIKDENGNYVPSYCDPDNFDTGSGGVSMDFTGTSGTYVVPPNATSLELATIGTTVEGERPEIHTIVIPKHVTSITGLEEGVNRPDIKSIVVSKENKYYASADGVLYDAAQQSLLLCPPGKTSITAWPKTLHTISSGAFAYSQIKELTLPDTVHTVCEGAFKNTYIKTLTLPESVESVGAFAFIAPTADEGELARTIVLKGSVPPALVDYSLYYLCDEGVQTTLLVASDDKAVYERYLSLWGMSLARIYGGETALSILKAESGLHQNYRYDEAQSGFVELATGRLVCWNGSKGIYRTDEAGTLALVKWTASDLFVDLTKPISDLPMPFTVDRGAFMGCTMKGIRLPEDLQLPENTFAECRSLSAIICYAPAPFAETLGAPASCAVFVKPDSQQAYTQVWGQQVRKIYATSQTYTALTSGIVFDSSNSRLLDVPMDMTSLSIPSYVTTIYDGAAQGRTALQTITGGSKLTAVGSAAFEGCTSLSTVSLGTQVTSIGDAAFKGCTRLQSVVLPASVTQIGQSAFEGCARLTSATSDNGVYLYVQSAAKSVGARAFKDCTSLKSAFWYTGAALPDSCFEGCTSLVSFTYLNQTLTEIGDGAFKDCQALVSISTSNTQSYLWVQDTMTQVGPRAFQGCSSLSQVYWYGGGDLPASCFEGCTSLRSWAWGVGAIENVEEIGDRAFYGCAAISGVLFCNPDYPSYFGRLAAVGSESFYGCTAMTTAYLSASVASIGDNAFGGRGGSPLTLTMAAETPPAVGAVDSTENLVIFVPDSDEHQIYGAYREAWAHWLGDIPEQIVKTANGAETQWPDTQQQTPDPTPDAALPEEPSAPDAAEEKDDTDETPNDEGNGETT